MVLKTTEELYKKLYTSEKNPNQGTLIQWLQMLQPAQGMDRLTISIDIEELETEVREAPKRKAPGPDSIQYEL